MGLALLDIGTATDRINLLSPRGVMVQGWRPQITSPEDVYHQSSLADYRQLVGYRRVNVVETMPLIVQADDDAAYARQVQHLRQMLEKARDYWATRWQDEIVYLRVRGDCETNPRYAEVSAGDVDRGRGPRAL